MTTSEAPAATVSVGGKTCAKYSYVVSNAVETYRDNLQFIKAMNRTAEKNYNGFTGRVLERGYRRIAIARIDEFVGTRLDEPRFGGLGAGIGKTLRQIDRLGHLAVLAAPRATMHGNRACVPTVVRFAGHNAPFIAARPRSAIPAGGPHLAMMPGLFSGFFCVGRNPAQTPTSGPDTPDRANGSMPTATCTRISTPACQTWPRHRR